MKVCPVLSEQGREQTWVSLVSRSRRKNKRNKNNRPMSRGFWEAGQLNRQSTGPKVCGLGEQVVISIVRWQGGWAGLAIAGRQWKAKKEPRSMQSQDLGNLSGISRVLATCLGSWAGQRLKREKGEGRNKSKTEFQVWWAWHIRQVSKREIQAEKSKTEGEFSELGHQVGA